MNYATSAQNITWPVVGFVGVVMGFVVLALFILVWGWTRR